MMLEDVQKSASSIEIPIDHVGIKDLRYPITVLDKKNNKQETVSKVSMSVDLPYNFKGTHMSRFIEVLNRHRGEITLPTLIIILEELKDRLEAGNAKVKVTFPYFIERAAPISKSKAVIDYNCSFIAEAKKKKHHLVLGVEVPVTTLCPCSKMISDYGAHNQRGYVNIEVSSICKENGEFEFVWIEELIEIAENAASGPVYSYLKREDERHVTMKAFDNPVFVEDVVRNVAKNLKLDSRIDWFRVHAENHESIHNHNAFAEIEWKRS